MGLLFVAMQDKFHHQEDFWYVAFAHEEGPLALKGSRWHPHLAMHGWQAFLLWEVWAAVWSKTAGLVNYCAQLTKGDCCVQLQILLNLCLCVGYTRSLDKTGRSHSVDQGHLHFLGWAVTTCSFGARLCHSLRWLCTELPTRTGLASSPHAATMSRYIWTFSPSSSGLALKGHPYFRIPSR